ncbi:glycosyltransferase family 4 protein [Persephonella sp. KM09-Lau-8]|uniref:glycosyltransferase family 4 protein n=1 Tax=Persephonella sp. KM09-Lau-8 TaxID=1158345 RepID=UPI00049773EF|nr:glycosyltransferase family 4 protein [Persephonella sp. KM09-Lau-8]
MKILLFNTLYYPNLIGGAEKSVQLLAEGLLKEGEEPIVVTTSSRDYIDYVNGVKVYYVKTNNLYWAYNAGKESKLKKPIWHLIDSYNFLNKKIAYIIEKERPDIIHTNNLAGFSVIVWKFAKDKNIKIIHTLRDYYLLCPKSTMFNEKLNRNCGKQCCGCKLYSFPKKLLSQDIDAVVGVSKFILNKHLEYGYFKNTKIKKHIYNPVTVSTSVDKNISKNIRLGIIGLLAKSKGIEFVLDKFSKMKLERVELHIYGKGKNENYENYLIEKYSLENIFFEGFKSPKEIFSNIDILIIPSLWHEPFSRVLIESYSYGVPVLASKRGGIPENVIEGKTGFLFDPDKNGDFHKKFKDMISYYTSNKFDPSYIQKFARDNFSIKNVLNEYIKIYSNLLK